MVKQMIRSKAAHLTWAEEECSQFLCYMRADMMRFCNISDYTEGRQILAISSELVSINLPYPQSVAYQTIISFIHHILLFLLSMCPSTQVPQNSSSPLK